jgi:hypothetical protein
VTILEFPHAAGRPPRIPDSDTLRHAAAFCDLEAKLCDCVSMARIAAQAVMNIRTDDRELVFVVEHASEMLEALKVDYYDAYHGEKPLEP